MKKFLRRYKLSICAAGLIASVIGISSTSARLLHLGVQGVAQTQVIASSSISCGSSCSFTVGSSGQTIGTVSVTMNPASPSFLTGGGAFSLVGSGGGCSGGNTSDAAIGSTTGIITNTNSGTPAGSFVACVQEAKSGISNSPQYLTVAITGNSGGPTGGPLPAPFLGAWLQNTSAAVTLPTLISVAPKYNHINFVGTHGPDTSGTLTLDTSGYPGGGSALATDIPTWLASTDSKGHHRTIIVMVTDENSGTTCIGAQFLTPTNATNAYNSLVSMINTYGFNGIQWDLESGDANPGGYPGDSGVCWNKTTVDSIDSQLKAHFGGGFLITQSPRPFELHAGSSWGEPTAGSVKRQWMTTMDMNEIQYYFHNDGSAWDCTHQLALQGGTDGNGEGLSQFVNGSDGGVTVPANKIVMGQALYGPYCNVGNQASIFSTLAGTYTGLRGAEPWALQDDISIGYTFETTFGSALGL